MATDKLDLILSFIVRFFKFRGYYPTYGEIMAEIGARSKSAVFYHMQNLFDEGRLVKVDKFRYCLPRNQVWACVYNQDWLSTYPVVVLDVDGYRDVISILLRLREDKGRIVHTFRGSNNSATFLNKLDLLDWIENCQHPIDTICIISEDRELLNWASDFGIYAHYLVEF